MSERKKKHDDVLTRQDNGATVTITSPDIPDATSDDLLMTMMWRPRELPGPKSNEYEDKEKPKADAAQAGPKARTIRKQTTPNHIDETMAQYHSGHIKWERQNTCADNINRVNEETYDAAKRAHQEGDEENMQTDKTKRRQTWKVIKSLIQWRNHTTDAEERRTPTATVDRMRRDMRGEEAREDILDANPGH